MESAKRRFKTPDEAHNWSLTKERIGRELKEFYQACTTQELPPRLLAVVKKLDEEQPELLGEHVQTPDETKD